VCRWEPRWILGNVVLETGLIKFYKIKLTNKCRHYFNEIHMKTYAMWGDIELEFRFSF